MCKTISLLFACTLFLGNLLSQSCLPNGAVFQSQSDVSSFYNSNPDCTEILGNIQISGSDIRNLSGLRNITKIHGNLEINQTQLKNLGGLEKLEEINGNLIIYYNEKLENLSGFDNLKHIGGNLTIEFHENLRTMEGFPKLETVGSNFNLDTNFFFMEAPDLEGFENLKTVGGNFRLYGNLVKNMSGINNLETIEGDFFMSLNTIGTFPITGFSKLKYVGGDFEIETEDANSLIGFRNLETVKGAFTLDNLRFLENLNDFKKVNLRRSESMKIVYNTEVPICNTRNICEHIIFNKNPDYTFKDNAEGCRTNNEVLESCKADLSKINVHVFYDLNQNKIKDDDEKLIPNSLVRVESLDLTALSNQDTVISIELFFGNHQIFFDIEDNEPWELTTDESAIDINLSPSNHCDSVFFGIYPKKIFTDFSASLNNPVLRCNNFITFTPQVNNTGTTISDGILWFKIDEAIDSFEFITTPNIVVGDTLFGWNFTDLHPNYSFQTQIGMKVPGPPDFTLGDYLRFETWVGFIENNSNKTSDTFYYFDEVQCSYDPNDKLVSPNREDDLTLFDENLFYTIRFQNTGNAEAYDVVIRDTLDENLNLKTIKILGSSHPDILKTVVENGRNISFEFKSIFLPDSTTNFDESQGYISYSIKSKNGLPENTPIKNTASIYFDQNPPIVTNTTENVMVSYLPGMEPSDNEINLFPNPTDGKIYLSNNNLKTATVIVSDPTGRVLQVKELTDNNFIQLPGGENGLFFLKIETEEGIVVKRAMKFN